MQQPTTLSPPTCWPWIVVHKYSRHEPKAGITVQKVYGTYTVLEGPNPQLRPTQGEGARTLGSHSSWPPASLRMWRWAV